MAHHNGSGSWNDRELARADMTTRALNDAGRAILAAIKTFPETSDSDHRKGNLLQRIAAEFGNIFPTDMEGHPTLAAHPHAQAGMPETIGDMKHRLDKLANHLSNDSYMQDMCRAATDAAVTAARSAMTAKTSSKH